MKSVANEPPTPGGFIRKYTAKQGSAYAGATEDGPHDTEVGGNTVWRRAESGYYEGASCDACAANTSDGPSHNERGIVSSNS